MLLVRDIMYCKPGKVRPMVEKFKKMKDLMKDQAGATRILTDLSGERFWTVIFESEVPSMEAYMSMDMSEGDAKAMEDIMKDYHDLVLEGRREIFTIEE